ncbi:MAG: Panacea domain-containing protein [Candidatus Parcubacteria bacterium]|nr:Panacea domain-containing protein [Candidatus Parcubacteria bacterium]
MNEDKKTKQIISYIVQNHENSSVTTIMKLLYLVDLISVKKTGKKITDFEYLRYNYGPFDKQIYKYLEALLEEKVIISKLVYSSEGNENIIYSLNEESDDINFNEIQKDELVLIDNLLNDVRGYGAKALTEIAYKTKPMQALGATLGGNESIGAKLDLSL